MVGKFCTEEVRGAWLPDDGGVHKKKPEGKYSTDMIKKETRHSPVQERINTQQESRIRSNAGKMRKKLKNK